jgi:hypothetical protein
LEADTVGDNQMQLDIGYHIMTEEAANEHGEFDEQMSVVEFLRHVERQDDLPYDVTVYGLDDLLLSARDPEDICEYVHSILRDRASFISHQNPCVQFVVEDIEYWDEVVLPAEDEKIELSQIFRSMEKSSAGWYTSKLNVIS